MFSSKAYLKILFNYFSQYDLQSCKYGQILKAEECYQLMLKKRIFNFLKADLGSMVLLK